MPPRLCALPLACVLVVGTACGPGDDGASVEPAAGAGSTATIDEEATTTTTTEPVKTSTTTSTTTAPVETSTTVVAGSACVRVTDFDDASWFIVNDGVMGGRSSAAGVVDDVGLTWTGTIVTAGGGFSSIRGPVDGQLEGATSLTMRIRTDGRSYELLADDTTPGQGRVTHYAPIDSTGGDWEEVSVSLVGMEPRIFGSLTTAEPFAPDLASQIGVILADGVDGEFRFEIDWIDACP